MRLRLIFVERSLLAHVTWIYAVCESIVPWSISKNIALVLSPSIQLAASICGLSPTSRGAWSSIIEVRIHIAWICTDLYFESVTKMMGITKRLLCFSQWERCTWRGTDGFSLKSYPGSCDDVSLGLPFLVACCTNVCVRVRTSVCVGECMCVYAREKERKKQR